MVMVQWENDFLISYNSSKNYHQENATEPHRLPKDVAAACGAVMFRFHGVFSRYKCSCVYDGQVYSRPPSSILCLRTTSTRYTCGTTRGLAETCGAVFGTCNSVFQFIQFCSSSVYVPLRVFTHSAYRHTLLACMICGCRRPTSVAIICCLCERSLSPNTNIVLEHTQEVITEYEQRLRRTPFAPRLSY